MIYAARHFEEKKKRLLTRTLSVTSGKGGVGKSTLVANMAIQFGKRGQRVLLLDGDLNLANLDILFGVKGKKSLRETLKKGESLKTCLIPVSENVSLLPSSSEVYNLNQLDFKEKALLLDKVNELEGFFDYMIIDTAPGVNEDILYFNSAAEEVFVVITPDPASLADSYSLIKILSKEKQEKKFSIICNMVRNQREAIMLFDRFYEVINRFLLAQLDYKGYVPMDLHLRKAVRSQQLISKLHPSCPSSLAIKALSENFMRLKYIPQPKGGLHFFWHQLIQLA